MAKNRNWCFTLNNYTEEEVEAIKVIECNYLIFGKEVGESGTPHLQGYIEFKNARHLGGVKKLIGSRAHLETRKGTAEQASTYCKKEGNEIFEVGKMSHAGARTDLTALRDKILEEDHTEVIVENFELYCRYRGGIDALIDYKNLKKKRTTMTKGIWLYGETGVGKSHRAFELAGDDVYVWTDDNGWWDGYQGQRTVVINDFRGAIKYNEMLQMIDKWPHSVRRRGRVPMPFTSELVIVTSSLKPEDIYNGVLEREDSIDQLLRRIEVIKLTKRNLGTEVPPGNTELGVCQKIKM